MMQNAYLRETMESIGATLPSFKYVRFNEERLRAVALANALNDFTLPSWDFPGCQPLSHRAFPSHCFVWSAINFSFDHSRRNRDGKLMKFRARTLKGKEVSGAYAMEACVYRAYGEKAIDAENMLLCLRSFHRFKRAFQGINSMPMLRARYEMLLEARFVLEERFDGDVMNILEEGGYRAFGGRGKRGIVELLIDNFPKAFGEDMFADKFYFSPRGQKFYFFKRPQLFALMYHGRAMASGGVLRPIADIEDIGPIADYELPKSYAADKILIYEPSLQLAIDQAMSIKSQSQPEIEIRLAFILAHVKELEIINSEREKRGLAKIHIGHLDYFRWQRGRTSKNLNHHLCFTTDY